MLITLSEAKEYLRVDSADDDRIIRQMMKTAGQMVSDIARMDEAELKESGDIAKTAELYAAAYLYEHREEADHKELAETLKCLLSTVRREAF